MRLASHLTPPPQIFDANSKPQEQRLPIPTGLAVRHARQQGYQSPMPQAASYHSTLRIHYPVQASSHPSDAKRSAERKMLNCRKVLWRQLNSKPAGDGGSLDEFVELQP